MKLKLGQTVYCIYHNTDALLVLKVYAIGEKSFITDNFLDAYDDAQEGWFDEYKEKWFTNLEEAKAKIWENLRNEDLEDIDELYLAHPHYSYYEFLYKE